VVIYEVNIQVPREIVIDYSAWLRLHVDEMLRLDVFYAAEVYVRHPEESDEENGAYSHFTIHYRARDRDAVESYLREHAPRMRQRILEIFKTQVKISRRILSRIRADELRGSEPHPVDESFFLRPENALMPSNLPPAGGSPSGSRIATPELDSDSTSV